MRPIYLALKDLRQIARDVKMLLFIFIMPIAFAYLMGLVMGGQATTADERPMVAWVDHDAGTASRGLADLLGHEDVIRLQDMTQAETEEAVQSGKVAAAVVIPPGLDQALQEGRPSELQVLAADASESNAQAAASLVQAAAARLTAVAQASRLSYVESAAWRPFPDEDESRAHMRDGMTRAGELWAVPALSLQVTSTEAAGPAVASGFAQSSPGMLVQFSIFGLMSAAIGLTVERRSGALRRLLTTPISRTGLIAGKLMSTFAVVFLQALVLVITGHVAFGVRYLASPLATLAVISGLSFCLAALGLVVGSLATSESAVVAASLILMFILSGMGGAWFPLEVTGPTFAAIGHLLPSAWAMDGFHSIILRGAGLRQVLAPAAILLAYGVAFLGLASWRFRIE
jgi:ABC-2 type transport system permease protein